MELLDKIGEKVRQRDTDLRRMADAGDIVERHVAPHLPATIDRFDVVNVSGSHSWSDTENRHRAATVTVAFKPKELKTDDDTEIAYGTIVKVIRALERAGWALEPVPELTALSWADGMIIAIKGKRTITGGAAVVSPGGSIPWHRGPGDDREIELRVQFDSMPETEVCKVVESVEPVPASTRTVRRVVCDGDGPAGLITSPALASPAVGEGE